MLREAEGIKRIIIKTGKTDLRLGIDKLASLIQMEYGLDPGSPRKTGDNS